MDIKNLTANVAANRANESVKPNLKGMEESNMQSSGTAASTDKVTLTDVLSQVMDLETQSKSVDVDNSAKVSAIKAAIQDGSYQVDTQTIAEKLIQTEALFSKA